MHTTSDVATAHAPNHEDDFGACYKRLWFGISSAGALVRPDAPVLRQGNSFVGRRPDFVYNAIYFFFAGGLVFPCLGLLFEVEALPDRLAPAGRTSGSFRPSMK